MATPVERSGREPEADAERDGTGRARLSRRSFLAVTGTVATAAVVPGCTTSRAPSEVPAEGPSAQPQPGLDVPEAAAGDRTLGRYLDPQQIALVTAIAARIIPGDESGPGAVDAGAVEYIDRVLAPYEGYPQRTSTQRPYATDEPPPPEDAEDDDVTELFDDLPANFFFTLIREHCVEGFLGDPVYGGNRDVVGWEHVGVPGAQRGYSPEELLDPNFSRPPQGLAQLPMMHAGHREDDRGGAALGSIRRRHPNGPLD